MIAKSLSEGWRLAAVGVTDATFPRGKVASWQALSLAGLVVPAGNRPQDVASGRVASDAGHHAHAGELPSATAAAQIRIALVGRQRSTRHLG